MFSLLIAAPTSGSGKTTVCRGLMAVLAARGLTVQPFKCGPDYIDTKYHAAVCGRPSYNLDGYMMDAEQMRSLFIKGTGNADSAIVEGMMGMFDGYERMKGSSADVAVTLGLPVVMVVDARAASYSMAPLLQGFVGFCRDVRVAGVIFNRVGSHRHRQLLEDVCREFGVRCYGCLPKDAALEQQSRHLGLDFSEGAVGQGVEQLRRIIEENVDIESIINDCTVELEAAVDANIKTADDTCSEPITIAVARNEESFSFIYAEHLRTLESIGRVVEFDPEKDEEIPADTSLLYLPGGYPELHARALSACRKRMESIRRYINEGGKVLAECGGMIYLSEAIELEDGRVPMVGVLPVTVSARKVDRRLSLGYRETALGGHRIRGHEFHYTQFVGTVPKTVSTVFNARGEVVDTPIFRVGNVIASYTHFYWGGLNPLELF